jgi:hypothetical protein
MSRFTRGRRRSSVFVGTALLALALGVSVGLAKSGPGQVKTLLYPTSLPRCPVPTDKHPHGKATLIREKGVITVRVHLHDAVPGKYVVVLGVSNPLSPFGCDLYSPGPINTFGVDSSGDGQGSGSFVGTTKQTFAVLVLNNVADIAYLSPLVKLGSS